MRIFRPHWLALSAVPFAIALIAQPDPPNQERPHLVKKSTPLETKPQASPTSIIPPSAFLQSILLRLKPGHLLQRSPPQPRSPVETPPTEYLPYPPPPNYSWPPGPHTQYPPPSETNPPAGWYGGAPGSTGGQGNSGAGSANPNAFSSSSSSSAAPSLRLSGSLLFPFNMLITFLPSSLLPPSHSHRKATRGNGVLKARDPVETPPTEYLPYPPPPSYQWPPGQNPQNENPQPSEFDPPKGWYTGEQQQQGQQGQWGQGGAGAGTGGNGNAGSSSGSNTGAGNQGTYPYPQQTLSGGGGGGKGGIGQGHLVWIVVVTIGATALVVGGLAYWYGTKKGAGGGGEEAGEKAGRFARLGEKVKFWQGWARKGKKSPPAAAAAAPPEDGDND